MTACGVANEGGQSSNPIIDEQEFIDIGTQRVNQYAQLTEDNLNSMLMDNTTKSLAENWQSVVDESGTFLGVKDGAVVSQEDGKSASLTIMTQFQKRDVRYTLNIATNEDGSQLVVTSEKFEPIYTMAENLKTAGVHTLIGFGIVFLVLILMVGIISCLRFVSVFQKKIGGKSGEEEVVPALKEEVLNVDYEKELVDDLELVAVITAAIAASENTSIDGLVVRSIKRAKAANWKRA